ncbi:hypothetical protein DFH09DRAFT_1086766 [Mycena vulgaris]|nr:hypothetical protein DFH09DRAFT_1086766 [Mycena vulgaris]
MTRRGAQDEEPLERRSRERAAWTAGGTQAGCFRDSRTRAARIAKRMIDVLRKGGGSPERQKLISTLKAICEELSWLMMIPKDQFTTRLRGPPKCPVWDPKYAEQSTKYRPTLIFRIPTFMSGIPYDNPSLFHSPNIASLTAYCNRPDVGSTYVERGDYSIVSSDGVIIPRLRLGGEFNAGIMFDISIIKRNWLRPTRLECPHCGHSNQDAVEVQTSHVGRDIKFL